MMPPVVVIASVVGVIAGAVTAHLTSGLGYRANKAVVWSFVAIVIWDMIFAIAFFF